MNQDDEALASALMDGEIDTEEYRGCSSQTAETMRHFWQRYYQALSSVNGEKRPFVDWDISDCVHRKLQSLNND